MVQPSAKLLAFLASGEQLDPFSNFAEADHAQVQIERSLAPEPLLQAGVGVPCRVRDDTGIEQKAHSSSSRPRSRDRWRSRSTSASGDSRRKSTRSTLGRVSRSYSSAETITTASRPPRVTRCGLPVIASRTTRLN